MGNKTVFPYIPNSVPEIQREMLDYVGAKDVMDLYEEVPEQLRLDRPLNLPDPIRDEQSIKRHMEKILAKNVNCNQYDNFMGAGCAQHYVPAVCDEIMSRGELLTCYGAETWADHGKYQIFFEYQSMMGELLEMDFLTVPCHCGGQAAATGLLMARRITGRKKVLLPKNMTPQNLSLIRNYCDSFQEAKATEIVMVDYDPTTGRIDLADLQRKIGDDVAAVLLENPNYLGVIESEAAEVGKIAKAAGAEFVVYADPITLGVMEAPAKYGATIAVGDIHSVGLHLQCGGAQGGYIASPDDMKYIREFKELVDGVTETKVPGEIAYCVVLVERTHYAMRENGKEFTGTQNNLWTAPVATYLALMGPKGMQEIGNTIMTNAAYAGKKLSAIPGVKMVFTSPYFKEFVLNFDLTGKTVAEINKSLLANKIFGGVDLSQDFPELGQSALFCVTEMNDKASIDRLVHFLTAAVQA